MPAFVFLCDVDTEQECLDRRLFGTNPGEQHQYHYSKIVVGDLLFLYNLHLGTLRGPYAATTACRMNIEPLAWKKSRRKFPWQVRVDDSSAFKVPLPVDQFGRPIPLSKTGVGLLPPAELSREQAEALLDAIRNINK